MRAFLRAACSIAVALTIGGCGSSTAQPPATVTGWPFPVVSRQLYQADAPVAVMTLADASGGTQHGSIRGIIHGWPFPHADPGGDFGEGLFTYRIDFVVTDRAADGARMPLRASGLRTVYFHRSRTTGSIARLDTFAGGEPIITGTVELWFDFNPAASTVRMTATIRQTGAKAFVWNNERVIPPNLGEQTLQSEGYYSAALGGYVFNAAK